MTLENENKYFVGRETINFFTRVFTFVNKSKFSTKKILYMFNNA